MSTTVQVLLITVLLTQIIITGREFWRNRQDRIRERNGLLRILYSELSINRSELEMASIPFNLKLSEKSIRKAKQDISKLIMSTKAWEDTRVKLAHHLPSGEFAILAGHYRDLETLPTDALQDLESLEDDYPDDVRFDLVTLPAILVIQERGEKSEQIIQKYVPDVTYIYTSMGDLIKRERSLEDRGSGAIETPPVEEAVRSSWWRRLLFGGGRW